MTRMQNKVISPEVLEDMPLHLYQEEQSRAHIQLINDFDFWSRGSESSVFSCWSTKVNKNLFTGESMCPCHSLDHLET